MSTDKLSRFLQDLYDQECEIDTTSKENDFIKTGIESIVDTLAEEIYRDGFRDIALEDEFKLECVELFTSTKRYIVKAGSFYEENINKFPGGFDFIIPLFSMTPEAGITERIVTLTSRFLKEKYEPMKELIKKHEKDLKYPSVDVIPKITFKTQVESKPAHQLTFNYDNEHKETKQIIVNLIPAVMLGSAFTKSCNENNPFKSHVNVTGRVVFVNDGLAFTTTEIHFMTKVLSSTHQKVYRLLKFLINGHDDKIDKLEEGGVVYTSYLIKSVIICHHFKCKRFHVVDRCLLEVLTEMSEYKKTDEIPIFSEHIWRKGNFVLRQQLKNLVKNVKTINNSKDSCYAILKQYIPRSVTAQYVKDQE